VQEIEKMTDFAQQSPPAHLRVMYPAILGNIAGFHPVGHDQGSAAAGKKLFDFLGQGGKPPVESHHQEASAVIGGDNLLELRFRQA